MKFHWPVIAIAGLVAAVAVIAADPAPARPKHKAVKVQRQCADRPQVFSWGGIFFNPAPQPNGCAPPVYQYGKYIGQDPDPNIRQQLKRDPATGYSPL